MGKGRGSGTWKYILVEVGVAVLAVLGKEIAERAANWLTDKDKKKEESQESPESESPSEDPQKSSKTDSENGTS